MLEAAVPSPNTLLVEEAMLLLKEGLWPKDDVPPNPGELPKEGALPKTGALPKPPVEEKTDKSFKNGMVPSHVLTITKKSQSTCCFSGVTKAH